MILRSLLSLALLLGTAQAFAEGDARGQRQPGRQHDEAEPGRALSDGGTAATTYAMHEREMT